MLQLINQFFKRRSPIMIVERTNRALQQTRGYHDAQIAALEDEIAHLTEQLRQHRLVRDAYHGTLVDLDASAALTITVQRVDPIAVGEQMQQEIETARRKAEHAPFLRPDQLINWGKI